MANFTKTVSNSVNVFGDGPSTKWGSANFPYTMTWGTAKWGEGLTTSDSINSIPFEFVKNRGDSLGTTSTIGLAFFANVFISDALSPASDMSMESVTDGTGLWDYVFTGGSTNAEDTNISTWTAAGDDTTVYTSGTSSVVSWSSQ